MGKWHFFGCKAGDRLVSKRQGQQQPHLAVLEAVVDHLARTPPTDDAQRAQQAQVLRDGRLGHADDLRQVADAQRMLA